MQSNLPLETPNSWPIGLLNVLENHYDLFLAWKKGLTVNCVKAYDQAIDDVERQLQLYSIVGWHCTRLTDNEISTFLTEGIQLPNATVLDRRIDECVKANLLTHEIVATLKGTNQAQDSNRAGKFYFCFFIPAIAGESGISRFFRYWGGEALYNSHEDNPVISKALSAFGTPCVITVDVPIASLKKNNSLACNIVQRFLISKGYSTGESINFVSGINQGLSPENIRGIVRFPTSEFFSLTGCSSWVRKLA